MKSLQSIIVVLIVVIFTRCTPSPIFISNSDFESINLKLKIESTVDSAVSEILTEKFQNFIEAHNSKNGPFFLTNYETHYDRTISLHIIDNKLVKKNQQVAGVLVTAIGMALPIIMVNAGSPIFVGFYYIPQDKSIVNVYVSEDINGMNAPYLTTNFSNSGFLRSYDKQIVKHGKKFDEYLSLLVLNLEKEYVKKNKDKNKVLK